MQRRFSVEMRGEWHDGVFILTERFRFADGERQERIWHLRRLDEHRYEASAGDVVGTARGEAYGQAFNLRYRLRLPVKGRSHEVAVDDWIYLQPDGSAINHAVMRKFGLRVGEIVLHFRRRDGWLGPR